MRKTRKKARKKREKSAVKINVADGTGTSINAHRITTFTAPKDFISNIQPSERKYTAGKTPRKNDFRHYLLEGVESRRGVFEFITRDAHAGYPSADEHPLGAELRAWFAANNHGDLELNSQYAITAHRKIERTDDYQSAVLTVRDKKNGRTFEVPFTQMAVPFVARLFEAESIKRAHMVFQKHNSLRRLRQTDLVDPDDAQTMIISYGGAGRNATLIAYSHVARLIDEGVIVSQAQLDEQLEYVITQGRLQHNPRFVRSKAQLIELRRALVTRWRAREQQQPNKELLPTSKIPFTGKAPGTAKYGVQRLLHWFGPFQVQRMTRPASKIGGQPLSKSGDQWAKELATAKPHKPPKRVSTTALHTDEKRQQYEADGYTTLLSLALAVVCSKDSEAERLRIVQKLRDIDWPTHLTSVYTAIREGGAINESTIDAKVWQVAMQLASTSRGFEVIEALSPGLPDAQRADFEVLAKSINWLTRQAEGVLQNAFASLKAPTDIAAQAALATLARLAGQPEDAPDVSANAWAITAVKNDLYEKNSPQFAFIQARALKVRKWLARAEKRRFWRPRNPLVKKTPFVSLRSGTQGVERGDIDAHIKDFVGNIQKACDEWVGKLDKEGLSSKERRTKKLIAELRTLLDDTTQPEQAIQKLLASHGRLSLRRLFRLAGLRWQQPNWVEKPGKPLSPLHNYLRKAQAAAYGQNTALKKLTSESIEDTLCGVIDKQGGASRLKLFDGGTVGISLRHFTLAFEKALETVFGLLVRIRVDLQWFKTRQAGFELAMPPYNMEMLLMSADTSLKQAGFGAAVGPDFRVAALTAGIDASAGAENFSADGISFRLPRYRGVKGAEKIMKDQFKRVVGKIFKKSDDDGASLLKDLFHEFPDLTVNTWDFYVEQRQQNTLSAELNATAGVYVKGVASAGISVRHQPVQDRQYRDRTGSLRVDKRVSNRFIRASVYAKIGIRPVLEEGQTVVGLYTMDAAAGEIDFLTAGFQVRREIASTNGRINTQSFYEIEYPTFADFRRSVEENLSAWVEAKKSKDTSIPEEERTQAARRLVINAVEKFEEHIARLGTLPSFQLNDTVAERFEIREAIAERIELLWSAADLARRAGRSTQAEAFDAQAKALLDDTASYQETSFRLYAPEERRTTRFGLISATGSAQGVHAKSRLM
jgi:hypothetical protein